MAWRVGNWAWHTTPLHEAVRANDIGSIRTILREAAFGVDAKDSNDLSPLHIAAMGGFDAALSVLISHGCDVSPRNSLEESPLHLAARNGHADSIQVLVSNGASVDEVDHRGRTALHMAAFVGSISAMRCLLNVGALIDLPDENGNTPLHEASRHGVEAVGLLLESGADPGAMNAQGQLAADIARRFRNHSAAERLGSYGHLQPRSRL